MSGRSEPLKKTKRMHGATDTLCKEGFCIDTSYIPPSLNSIFPPSFQQAHHFSLIISSLFFWYGRLGASDSSSGAVCAVNTRAVVSDTWKEQGGGVWEYADKWCFHCCTCYCFFWAHHCLPCCHWCSHLCH